VDFHVTGQLYSYRDSRHKLPVLSCNPKICYSLITAYEWSKLSLEIVRKQKTGIPAKDRILFMKYILLSVCIVLFIFTISWSGEVPGRVKELKDRKDRISYSLGYQIGEDFKKEKTDIDPEAFLKGVRDALARSEPMISTGEMKPMLRDMKKKVLATQRREKMEMVEQRTGAGKKFLEDNAKKEGVITLESGVQYKVIREGSGKRPKLTDRVKIHYRGTGIDGTEFSSSFKRGEPKIFYVNGVIPGITEVLQLMKEGAKWRVFIPYNRAFGTRGLHAYRTVIYDLELISIEPPEQN
jgi:FKBP-type peptidyl-prolyl cis-trans isomerase FklB